MAAHVAPAGCPGFRAGARRLSGIPTSAQRALDGARSFGVGSNAKGILEKQTEVLACRRRYLRLTEVAGDKTDEKLRHPCSSRSAEVIRCAPVANVFNSNGESSLLRYGSANAAYALDVDCEIIGSKSEAHDFRRKRELVSAGQ
jgi:hypothetical protein